MLRRDSVDCENWDLFSVWAGRHTLSRDEREAIKLKKARSRRDPQKARQAALITKCLQDERHAEAVPLMVEYLAQHEKHATPMRLRLAALLVRHQGRPAQARRVLSKLRPDALTPQQLQLGRRAPAPHRLPRAATVAFGTPNI